MNLNVHVSRPIWDATMKQYRNNLEQTTTKTTQGSIVISAHIAWNEITGGENADHISTADLQPSDRSGREKGAKDRPRAFIMVIENGEFFTNTGRYPCPYRSAVTQNPRFSVPRENLSTYLPWRRISGTRIRWIKAVYLTTRQWQWERG